MTYTELLALAQTAKDQDKTLITITGKPFKVGIYRDVPFFIPQSTRQGRSDGRKAAERFLERYNVTLSMKSADYQDVTRNASYFLALLFQSPTQGD
ncbi:MAG: hypothetical protein ACKVQS_11765 [Fimbriimonadaceae bacterium]